jgi:segregation and condensation protein B
MERETFEQDVQGGTVALDLPASPDAPELAVADFVAEAPAVADSQAASTPIEIPPPQPMSRAIDRAELEALIFSSSRPLSEHVIIEALFGETAAAAEAPTEGEAPTAEKTAEKPAEKPTKSGKGKASAWKTPRPGKDIARLVASLNEEYAQSGRAFRIELVAGGYRVMTLPKFAGVLARLHQGRTSPKLSKPAIETLAIIAYQQPITRARLEAIRGVACGEVLRSLLERRLIAISGRSEELGRPMLYSTTRQFLDQFGLSSVKDLPAPGELRL